MLPVRRRELPSGNAGNRDGWKLVRTGLRLGLRNMWVGFGGWCWRGLRRSLRPRRLHECFLSLCLVFRCVFLLGLYLVYYSVLLCIESCYPGPHPTYDQPANTYQNQPTRTQQLLLSRILHAYNKSPASPRHWTPDIGSLPIVRPFVSPALRLD